MFWVDKGFLFFSFFKILIRTCVCVCAQGGAGEG